MFARTPCPYPHRVSELKVAVLKIMNNRSNLAQPENQAGDQADAILNADFHKRFAHDTFAGIMKKRIPVSQQTVGISYC